MYIGLASLNMLLLVKQFIQVDVDPFTFALPFKSHSEDQLLVTRGRNQTIPYIHYKCNNDATL